MLKRLVLAALLTLFPALAIAASSTVGNLTASGAIVGSQLTYCPITATSSLKCTFTQVDAFINAQFSGDCTAGGTGALTCTETNGTSFGSLATVTAGTGVATAAANNVNTNGGLTTSTTTSVVVGAINTGGGSGTAPVGLADVATGSYLKSGGTTTIPAWQAFGTNVQAGVAAALNSTTANSLATTAAPLTVGTGGTISTADGYYICTTTCSVTLPTPAAGYQFCIRNDAAVTTVITIAAISSVQFEKTDYSGYGTVTTGTMTSGGALGDKICLIGRDTTHYLVGAYVGTWANS